MIAGLPHSRFFFIECEKPQSPFFILHYSRWEKKQQQTVYTFKNVCTYAICCILTIIKLCRCMMVLSIPHLARQPVVRWTLRLVQRRALASAPVVFDRGLKRRQREITLSLDSSPDYDYLRTHSAQLLVDRLDDITKSFPLALDFGCHRGHLLKAISDRESFTDSGGAGGVETLISIDMASAGVKEILQYHPSGEKVNGRVNSYAFVADEEYLPFKPQSFDLIMSNLAMHWINDIPSVLSQVIKILKPDGAFVACMLGGPTLRELRHCFYLAEMERKGGNHGSCLTDLLACYSKAHTIWK